MRNSLGRTMNSETIAMPLLFARRFLERQGAVIEANPKGFDALLPQELAERLELPEYVSIMDGLKAESEGAIRDHLWISSA